MAGGTGIGTASKGAEELFHASEPALAKGLLELNSALIQIAPCATAFRNKYPNPRTGPYMDLLN